MGRVGAFFLIVLAVGLAVSQTPAAQGRRPMTLRDLIAIPRVQDAQLSPDGQQVSYMLAVNDWAANRQLPHIWRQPVSGGTPTQVTSTEFGETMGRWSADSQSLSYLARGENGLQLFLTSLTGGQSRQLTRHSTGVFGGAPPAWSPDGAWLYFLAIDPPSDLERERERLRDDVARVGEVVRHRHVWRVQVETGAASRVTNGSFSVTLFRLSRDGARLMTQRVPTPAPGDSMRGEIWLSLADGGSARQLTTNGIEESDAELSPDGRTVLFLAEANAQLEPYYNLNLFLMPADGGTPRLLMPDFPYGIDHAAWSPDGDAVLAVVNSGLQSDLYRIETATGKATPLTNGQHSVQFWSLSPTAREMVFQFDEPTRIGDVWTLPVDGGSPRRVTGVYDALTRDFELPHQKKFTWTGADGAALEGLLLSPPNHRPGTRSPLVVQLHGGPQESDKFGFGPGVIVNYAPVLNAKGYVVFRPNYRGSAGYGNVFLRDVVGHYFNNMHLDVLAGVDALIAAGIADPEKLAVMGWSAGGHLTNKLITTTTRFKAASSTAGAVNWNSFYAQTDIRTGRAAWFGGMPWSSEASASTFWDASPIREVSKVRTPTLVIAGEQDARVPMAQSLELFRALEANRVPTRLLVAPREGHQWGELRHQLRKANEELEWFERHVMGRDYTWETGGR